MMLRAVGSHRHWVPWPCRSLDTALTSPCSQQPAAAVRCCSCHPAPPHFDDSCPQPNISRTTNGPPAAPWCPYLCRRCPDTACQLSGKLLCSRRRCSCCRDARPSPTGWPCTPQRCRCNIPSAHTRPQSWFYTTCCFLQTSGKRQNKRSFA